MIDIETKYQQFCNLIEEENIWINPLVTFSFIARSIGASPRLLNKKIRREQGLGGNEIIKLYRKRYGQRLNSLLALYRGDDFAGKVEESQGVGAGAESGGFA